MIVPMIWQSATRVENSKFALKIPNSRWKFQIHVECKVDKIKSINAQSVFRFSNVKETNKPISK